MENFETQDKEYRRRMSSPYSFLWSLGYKNKLLEIQLPRLEAEDLAKNPIYTLKQVGLKNSLEKEITVLYKIRDLFPEFYANDYQFTTIGYPLVIFDSKLTLKNILNG